MPMKTKHTRARARVYTAPSCTYTYIYKYMCIKGRLLGHRDYANISYCQTKIFVIFRGVFIIFPVFQVIYEFIPLFLSEPVIMFCGNLFEKHWFRERRRHGRN